LNDRYLHNKKKNTADKNPDEKPIGIEKEIV
jgi:hypothetical protein